MRFGWGGELFGSTYLRPNYNSEQHEEQMCVLYVCVLCGWTEGCDFFFLFLPPFSVKENLINQMLCITSCSALPLFRHLCCKCEFICSPEGIWIWINKQYAHDWVKSTSSSSFYYKILGAQGPRWPAFTFVKLSLRHGQLLRLLSSSISWFGPLKK